MIKTDSIIKTKLRPPFTRANLVARTALEDKISQAAKVPLTLITAPAGFGKTTLTASYLNSCGIPAAWLSLDKQDNQSGQFLTYLITAFQTAAPSIGQRLIQALVTTQTPDPTAVLTLLINDLDQSIQEIMLVLDDYHEITQAVVHESLSFLLEHCPINLHLIIITRSDPPLPLSRLRARGQLVEIRANDLRFTEKETAEFLNQVMGFNIDAQSITALEEKTEGWITGLQMAALSMRNHDDRQGFIEGFSGSNRYILDYLIEEVLHHQPQEIQNFLLSTSILGRMTASLCDFLLDTGNDQKTGPESPSASILEYLERSNLFLVPLDDDRIWYRYHHLFADLLYAKLQQTHPELIPAYHIRASLWFEQNGFYHEAIRQRFLSEKIDQAAELIEQYGPETMQNNDPSILQMAAQLPEEFLLSRPILGLNLIWLMIIQGEIEKIQRLLNKFLQQKTSEKQISRPAWIDTFINLVIHFLSPGNNSFPAYSQVEKIPDNYPTLRNAADFLYVMTLARRGELDRSVEIAEACVRREKKRNTTPSAPSLSLYLTRGYLMQGRLQAAASLCREMIKAPYALNLAGNFRIDLGEVLCEWNQLTEAEELIREDLKTNQLWQNIMTEGFGLVALVRVLTAQGNFSGAFQTIDQLEKVMADPSQRPHEYEEDLLTLRIRTQLAAGDHHSTFLWADQIEMSELYQKQPDLFRYTLALIRLGQGKNKQVEELLHDAPVPDPVGSRTSRILSYQTLLSTAIARQGRTQEAFDLLESALSRAKPEGYLLTFLEIGEPFRDLLTAYLRSENPREANYARKILEAFPRISAAPQTAGLIEPLSERELEILGVMAEGKTNQEIARQLFIAPGTVKAHTGGIYRKLEVNNRTEAVTRARELGLLP